MDRLAEGGQRRFLDRLFQRRMRVAGAGDVLGRCAPNSMATPISAIRIPASGPMMWAPSTRSVVASARILTKPSVWPTERARLLAMNGNLPTL